MPEPSTHDEAFNFYNGVQAQIGSYFGAPPSPQFQSYRPVGDFSSQAYQHWGNRNFAPAMGIPSENPLIGVLGNMLLQKAFGADLANMRPIGQDWMSSLDFVEGRFRAAQSQNMMKDLHGLNAEYLAPRVGQAGYNMGAQMLFDAMNPGGSQVQAFNQLYSGQGRAFGLDSEKQRLGAYNSLLQMNEAFVQESGENKGGWDFRKAYGFDRNETAAAIDVAMRRGIGGINQEAFADAINENRGGDMMVKNNRLFAAAREVFGRDKSVEQLGELISNATDGLAGLDAGKTTELLQKIQATSKVIDISTQAFTEYSNLLKDMYRSVGITGASVPDNVMRSAKDARIATEMGRQTGDSTMGNLNDAMEAAGRNRLNLMRSGGMRQAKALAAITANLTDEQKASVQIKGMGSLADVMKEGGIFQQALKSGDSETLQRIINAANQSGSPYFGKGAVANKARNLSEEDERLANTVVDFSKTGEVQGMSLRRAVAKGMAGSLDKGIMAKIGKEGLDKIMGKLDSFSEAGDRNKVLDVIKNQLGGLGLSEKEQQDLASQFSIDASTRLSNKATLARFGFKSRLDANVAFARTGEKGQQQATELDAEQAKVVQRQQYLAEISGDVMRPFDAKELGGMALNLFRDIQNGTIKDEDIMGPDGKWDVAKIMELSKNYIKGGLKIDETRAMMKAASESTMNEAIEAGQTAYDKTIKDGGTEDDAQKARRTAMRLKVQQIYESELDEKTKSGAAQKSGEAVDKDDPASQPGSKRGGSSGGTADSTLSSEKMDKMIQTAERTNQLLAAISEKLPDQNLLGSSSKANSALSKVTLM
jgi:hypothetical protein